MKQISILLCLRYLQHRKIVLLSVAAVALSCALLIATDSLFTGFIDAFENSFNAHLGDVILEVPPGRLITEYDTLIQSIEQTSSVRSATAVLKSQGLLWTGIGKVRAVRAWGIELPRRLTVTPLQDALLQQKDEDEDQVSFDVPDAPDVIGGIVGIGVLAQPDEATDEYDMAAVEGMIGKRMALTTGTIRQNQGSEAASARFARRVIKFNLADVSMTGFYEFDQSFVMLPIDQLSAALHPDSPAAANLLHIRLAPNANEEEAIAMIRGIWYEFAADHLDFSSASVTTTKTLYYQMIAEYKKQMNVLLFIFGLVSMGIILLVFCIFYLIVMTRRKDIGILKSCGLSSPSVTALFVLFGTTVGTVGAIVGIGLGWLMIDNINVIEQAIATAFGMKIWKAGTYMFSRIPDTMHWGSVLWITGAGIGAAMLGSLIPAVAAARVKPVKTLQYE